MLAAYHRKNEIEAGCDEAGRGCYAGPVVAAAVILPKNFKHPLLNDSKKLSAAQREELRPIIEKKAIAFGIGVIDHEEIDRINILKASFKAMHQAIAALGTTPSLLLIDGNRFSAYPSIPHQCFVKGDGRFASIAAASILAKTYRDQLMQELHQEFPQYGWDQNKGYGTAAHRKAIEKLGLCRYHRKSFRLLPQQGELDY
ncbi:MAG TPA: ribonuclease HII [Chitinophagaceae bacterium]|nr:ribonuclease HII [Chitinophagaceae bacterium]